MKEQGRTEPMLRPHGAKTVAPEPALIRALEFHASHEPQRLIYSDEIEVTTEMLIAAINVLLERGVFQRMVDTETYMKNWDAVKVAIEAALKAR